MTESAHDVHLTQVQHYQFDLDFGLPGTTWRADEPPPLGEGAGPSPVQLLAAAVGNCLSASLLFALRKFKQAPEPLSCTVQSQTGRNSEGRLRVLSMTARLTLGVPAAQLEHLDRVLSSFEAYCTVTQSIAQGIPVSVSVLDAQGAVLK